MRQGPADRLITAMVWLLIIAVVLVIIYPLYFVVIASISDQKLVSLGSVVWWPQGFNVKGYSRVLTDARIWTGYRNTIIYSVLGTVVNMAVTMPVAYALSRREFRPRRAIMFLFTFTMFFGGGLIPSYLLYKQLGILNSMWVFILPGAVSVYNVIIARSFFETTIPEELFDAAQIDGVSYFGFFMKIALPLSTAIIAVIGLYYFVGHWNDFFTGLVFIRDYGRQPLQVVLRDMLLTNQTQTGQMLSGKAMQEQQQFADQIKYGAMIISSLPLIVIYPFLQKYFEKGVMIGAIKG
ncbi:carbohydrate ABC transporter permease [Bifidobacterium favimelis]|uniref:Carbohydrate ABC transporter permease n=1 Tax=Bifidobacterium favimelis TaxID=3122979 RepID=A0ABU8ZPT7_9BIFI